MKILGLISSLNEPASRARIIQYKDYFKRSGEILETPLYSPSKEAETEQWTHSFKKITNVNEWRTWNTWKIIARLPLLINQYEYDLIWQNRLLLSKYFFIE